MIQVFANICLGESFGFLGCTQKTQLDQFINGTPIYSEIAWYGLIIKFHERRLGRNVP